ncbi:MAG: hypothetical protein Pars2KO_18150 [Parasphingorhabdus sp.]
MNDENAYEDHVQSDQNAEWGDFHYLLIAHIIKQNQARTNYLSNIEFGEPVWDFLLDLIASEHFDKPSSLQDISQRLGISVSLCQRCVDYLLDRDAIFENKNQYSLMKFPWLVSEETKVKVKQWLNVCISEAPCD